MDEPYQRPDRQAIAEQVRASLPGAANNADGLDGVVTRTGEPDYPARFATHLSARMRALGWTQAELQEHAGISAHVAARAINGNGVELGVAAKLARVVGSMLPAMLAEYVCGTCEGVPPAGYACLECGTEGARL